MWQTANYKPEDLPEMMALTQSFYGDIEISNVDFIKWQYEKNPAGPAVIMLAKDQEKQVLAGQYIIIPMKIQQGSNVLTATLSLNTLTKKEYWGKGIFTGLAEEAFAYCHDHGLHFTYGFPNPNSYPGFIKKLHFKDLGKVPLLLRPINLKSLVSRKLHTALYPLAVPFNPLFSVRQPKQADFEVFEITYEHLELIDRFWSAIKTKYPIMAVRNGDFFKWRYFDIPLRDYKTYGIRQKSGDHLLGYIIGRCTEVAGMDSGMIVDFLVEPGHLQAGQVLISQMLHYFVSKNMDLAGALMMPQTEESHLLKTSGFFKCPKFLEPQPFPVVFRSHQELNEEFLSDFNNWFLTMGDYDVI